MCFSRINQKTWGYVIAIAMILPTAWSCKDNFSADPTSISTPNQAQPEAITVVDGRLKFSSQKLLETTVDELRKSKKTEDFAKQYTFQSMKESFDELIKNDIGETIKKGDFAKYSESCVVSLVEDNKKDYNMAISDPILASVVNSKGLLQVGDTIYKVSDKIILKTLSAYQSELFGNAGEHVKSIAVKHAKIQGGNNSKSGRVENFDDVVYQDYYTPENENLRSIKAVYIGTLYWGSLVYISLRVTHKRLNWYGWGPVDCSDLNVYGEAQWFYNPFNGSGQLAFIPWFNNYYPTADYGEWFWGFWTSQYISPSSIVNQSLSFKGGYVLRGNDNVFHVWNTSLYQGNTNGYINTTLN